MSRREILTEEERQHYEYWQGLLSGMAIQARRDGISPSRLNLLVNNVSLPTRRGSLGPVSVRIAPIFSQMNSGVFPTVVYLEISSEGLPVASGSVSAKWPNERPIVTRVEYHGNDKLGLDDETLGRLANQIGLILEYPDDA